MLPKYDSDDRKIACPILEDMMTCGQRRCGCGWPESRCRAMYPEEWAVAMLARDGLYRPDLLDG